jgi:ATP-dependent DNA helicase
MKLQNTVMQLRKVCSHPFLFDWPINPNTLYSILGEELVNASGKMMVLTFGPSAQGTVQTRT